MNTTPLLRTVPVAALTLLAATGCGGTGVQNDAAAKGEAADHQDRRGAVAAAHIGDRGSAFELLHGT
ncbi:hypothetical protein, partial [Nocardioides sp. NPDC000441]|uniref:hypothetical protein n=1 Tax=Nocardioides sp. NPDC000441 TaxID=3154256 RepID=UPI0033216B0B